MRADSLTSPVIEANLLTLMEAIDKRNEAAGTDEEPGPDLVAQPSIQASHPTNSSLGAVRREIRRRLPKCFCAPSLQIRIRIRIRIRPKDVP